jgi:hypothetical protein
VLLQQLLLWLPLLLLLMPLPLLLLLLLLPQLRLLARLIRQHSQPVSYLANVMPAARTVSKIFGRGG